jgi:predicted amidohydrolase
MSTAGRASMQLIAAALTLAALLGAWLPAAALAAAPAPFKAEAIAYDPAWGDLDGNIGRIAAALEAAGKDGTKLAVFPEQATTGYIFDDFAMIRPFLDTVPGKTTDALAAVARKYHMYAVVGIAELDPPTGLAYNTSALIGPEGYIGKYRKVGLNSQDQRLDAAGNLGFPVFDTELGRIMLLICYDDTYWQFLRLAPLHGVDIIAWASASDRVMPGTPPAGLKGDHSTVASVQHLAADSGAWVVAATRNGIEVNPLTGQKLYYNGGSSIWNPLGHKVAQLPVIPPEVLPSGVHGSVAAVIDPAAAAPARAALLARRRPELYGLLALHRAPTDATATATPRLVQVTAAQLDPATEMAGIAAALPPVPRDGLLVLPALFASGGRFPQTAADGEARDGPSETLLTRLAKAGGGWVAGSYPERDGDKLYHTVALAGPAGEIVARYRATHPVDGASPGHDWVVVPTALGRIGLALGDELAVPEVFGMLSALRADIIAAPGGPAPSLKVELDPALFNVPPPPGTPFAPYDAAKYGQLWVVASGWAKPGEASAAVIAGPEPVVATPPVLAAPGSKGVSLAVMAPSPGTWINQAELIAGQRPDLTVPLVLDPQGDCARKWREAPGWQPACW